MELIMNHNESNEKKVLSLLERFCLENDISTRDIEDTRRMVGQKKIIRLIEQEEL